MATTGAVLYIRPRAFIADIPGRHTGSVLYVAPRMLSGPYSETGVTASTNTRNKKVLPPNMGDVIGKVQPDGTVTISDQFWRFIVQEIHGRRLGGDQGSTVPDLVSTVETAQTAAATVAVTQTAIAQQLDQNAEVLTTAVESVKAAALPGSSQIATVQRYRQIEP